MTTDTLQTIRHKGHTGNGQAEASQVALDVLAADNSLNITYERIGDRRYPIEELTALRFLELSDLVVENATLLGEAGLLNQGTFQNLDKGDYAEMVKKIASVWKRAPDVLGRFFAIVLSGEQEDDGDYILRHIKLFTQVPRVIKAFMKVNPWRDLVDSFFQIGQEVRGAAEPQPQEPTNPGTSSQP